MEEAVEICKLRLFLKMVAQIEDVKQIEPLPDIDFNIQVGNTLVGYTTYDEVEKAVTDEFDFDNAMARIKEGAEDVDRLFEMFRQQQTELGGTVTPADKQALQNKLQVLEAELNLYLSGGYGIKLNDKDAYQSWLSSHKPFHWFIEFYGILKGGGFDVIIGNPPYVEYRKVKKDYTIKEYETESCGNLYAFIMEKTIGLLKAYGRLGFIIPVASLFTERYLPLQNLLRNFGNLTVSSYDDRPGMLFEGLHHIRLSIILWKKSSSIPHTLFTTRYNKWQTVERPNLFNRLIYLETTDSPKQLIAKLYSKLETGIWEKLARFSKLGKHLSTKPTPYTIYYHSAPGYWLRAMDFIPYFWNERDGKRISTSVKSLHSTTELDAAVVVAILNSSLFYWWFVVLSDCRSLNMREIRNFFVGIEQTDEAIKQRLSEVCEDLMKDLKRHAQRKDTNYKATGRVVYDEFRPRHSKPIIDKIDRLLAQHYGFTDEELDFIINYDIKYRMGLGND